MYNIQLHWLLFAAATIFWIAGIFHFWRLQSLSRATVNVTRLDRIMTILWLPLYLFTLTVLAVPYLLGLRRRKYRQSV